MLRDVALVVTASSPLFGVLWQWYDWLGPIDDWDRDAQVLSLSQSNRRVLHWNIPPSALAPPADSLSSPLPPVASSGALSSDGSSAGMLPQRHLFGCSIDGITTTFVLSLTAAVVLGYGDVMWPGLPHSTTHAKLLWSLVDVWWVLFTAHRWHRTIRAASHPPQGRSQHDAVHRQRR